MLTRLIQQVSPYAKAPHWYVAYSGGLDSHVLLHALATIKQQHPELPPLSAIHVHHQLQTPADSWQAHCHQQALGLGVNCLSFRVEIDQGGNIESAARDARYKVFAEQLEQGACLFMAHHEQDQIETFFYRLFRGAGVRGLMAMANVRPLAHGHIVRPLLSESRTTLEQYALRHQLAYVNDPSNQNIQFDRNYIRHELIPVINRRWSMHPAAISRAIENFTETDELLTELAVADIALLSKTGEASLNFLPMLQWSKARRNNALRYWLRHYDINLSSEQMVVLWQSVVLASIDAAPIFSLSPSLDLRRHNYSLYVVDNRLTIELTPTLWNASASIYIEGYGELSLSTPHNIDLCIKPRVGGEKIKPMGADHHKSVKHIFQEQNIAPWLRARVPLIYSEDTLIAVGDMVVSEAGSALLQGAKIIRS